MFTRIKKLTALLFAGVVAIAPTAIADDYKWTTYQSNTGIFEIMVPSEMEATNNKLRIDEQRVASSSTLISMHDQRRYKGTFKSYLVRLDQSIGPPLTHEQIELLLNTDLKDYLIRYEEMNPVVKNSELKFFNNKPGAEILVQYQDPELGTQNTRARILYTDASRLEMSLTGDPHILHGFKADKFFESMVVNEGLSYDPGKLNVDWKTHISPLGIFSVSLPPVIDPFVPEAPKITKTQKTDLISQTFLDPVWGQKIFYRVHGYKFDRNLSQKNLQKVIFEQHINKFRPPPGNIKFQKTKEADYDVIEAEFPITPPSKAVYATHARLRIIHSGRHLVVQEIICSKNFMSATLIGNLLGNLVFDPGMAKTAPAPLASQPADTKNAPQEAPAN
ncbi:MAG TPA: hypothetical protein DEA55_10800 [Rhodospirillaceae bacterium]|nr:hypothetical protein [Rhodospirillaceae bacterium]